ncbi:MAG: hypothetical protein ACLRSE_04235 [Alistipes finegoldii]
MKTKRIILFLAAAALFTGCFKDVSYKTTYVFKPLEQEKSGDPTQILADAKLYAFAADTSSWEVASYKDALAGVISQRGNRNEKISTPLAAGEPYEQEGVEGLLQMSFDRSSVMVVAVDTKNELYGYTQQEVPENTPKIYVTLIFKRWKQGYSYKDGKWLMFNDSYTPPIYIDSQVTAQTSGRGGRRTHRAVQPQGLRLCRRYDRMEDQLLQRCGAADHYLEERSQADADQPRLRSLLLQGVGHLRHEGQQSDADGGRDRSRQPALRLLAAGGRDRRGRPARKLPSGRFPPVEAGIPLCRGGRLARGQ